MSIFGKAVSLVLGFLGGFTLTQGLFDRNMNHIFVGFGIILIGYLVVCKTIKDEQKNAS